MIEKPYQRSFSLFLSNRDMDRALIAFSFDDGRLDNYTNALPILKKYNLPATFNVTTGYIEGVVDRELFDFPQPMTIPMVIDIFNNGKYEIAGHGYNHINTPEDITLGIHSLCDIFGTDVLCQDGNGFASPGSDLTEQMYQEMKCVLEASNIRYIRISCRYKKYRILKVFLRKVSRIVKWPWIYRYAYQDTLLDNIPDNIIYSIPVLSSTTKEQLGAVINYAIKKKKACVLMFHSIVPKADIHNTWDYDCNTFDRICEILSHYEAEGLLKVTTTMDLYNSLKS